jgi:hypothetical protein
VGGQRTKDVELYSPNGVCQFSSIQIPESNSYEISALVYIDGKIIACDYNFHGFTICWSFNISQKSWTDKTSLYTKSKINGVAFDNKLFMIDDERPQVFDPRSNKWSNWPAPAMRTGGSSCLIVWKDEILAIGGNFNRQGVQSYNTSSNIWTIRSDGKTSFNMAGHSCILVPGNKVLVLGSILSINNPAALYNIITNSWETLDDTTYNRAGSAVFDLNGRIFTMGGYDKTGTSIEEFYHQNNTWATIDTKAVFPRLFAIALSLPVDLFSGLEC